MSLWSNYWEKVGTAAGKLGTKLNLPEMNVSERLGSAWQPNSQVFGQEPSTTNQPIRMGPAQVPQPGPQNALQQAGQQAQQVSQQSGGRDPHINPATGVWDDNYYAATHGGGAGGFEAEPAEPQINYDAIFAPVMQAYEGLKGELQGSLDPTLASIEQGGKSQVTQAQAEESRRLRGYEGQENVAESTVAGNIASERRSASELMQGIHSKYGSTTGTGRFVSEIMGAQATRNIASARSALSYTLGEITSARSNLQDEVLGLIGKINADTEKMKVQARKDVTERMAEIDLAKAYAQTEKSKMKLDIINQYQQQISDVRTRNAAYQQRIFLQRDEAQNSLNQLAARAMMDYRVGLNQNPMTGLAEQASGYGNTDIGADYTGTGGGSELFEPEPLDPEEEARNRLLG